MMKIYKVGISIAIAVICNLWVNICLAQEGTPVVVRDFETWTRVGFKFHPNKVVAISFDEELRLWYNSAQVDEFFTNVKLSLSPIKKLGFGIGYRYIKENDENQYETHQRFAFDADYQLKLKRLAIQPRIRYQFKDELGISKDEGDELVKNLRFRLSLKYNIKNWKLDPVFSAEIFRQYENGTIAHFDKMRFTLSSRYKYKKYGQMCLFYRIERELNTLYPKTTNVFGIQYRFIAKK